MDPLVCELDALPQYLKDLVASLNLDSSSLDQNDSITVPTLASISQHKSPTWQYTQLLLRRHALTEKIAECGLYPPVIHERALVYEALCYADLAAADAFVVYTLCETVRSDDWVSDLEPVDVTAEPWPPTNDKGLTLSAICDALVVLYRSLVELGATEDAEEKFTELVERYSEKIGRRSDDTVVIEEVKELLKQRGSFFGLTDSVQYSESGFRSKFGWSRREIYPWNDQEPDRNSSESLSEINSILDGIATGLTAKVTILPALNEDGSQSSESWYQLGLFAAEDLAPGTEVLREKSLLTAIRPLDDALCDACGADLEPISRDSMRQCPGEGCDTTFCSEDCATRAAVEYHKPNVPQEIDEAGEEDTETSSEYDLDHPPLHAPFCANTVLHEVGRTSSTTTAEWDLYFLLLTRTIQMSITQRTNALSLPSIKYLWGDFNPTPNATDPAPAIRDSKPTLPWSLHHNLTLPLQYFETLTDSVPDARPYSAYWLANFDWWAQSTLLAKFRGVANAQQSTFDGKAEIAAVHPMWCLANHSCQPNVKWTPTGERVFTVRDGNAIKAGQEIWSHYTDVRLPVKERRERLMEVLGGICRCERCLREAQE